jgi:hypothetical protein
MAPKNRLLEALPGEVYARIEPFMKQVPLARGEVLHHPGDEIRHLYFRLDCLISIAITMLEGNTAGVGAVGSRELGAVNAWHRVRLRD